jgi:uncharacterized protein (DUF58 family)
MWNILAGKKIHQQQSVAGIDISLEALIALRSQVSNSPMQSEKTSRAVFAGQHSAKIRGRGIEFDTTRDYQAGDDIRRMAWRVTARSLKPHVKVYQEERERPVWLGVDLSPSLFFGTRCSFKSVCSIKQAAFLGWSYLLKAERIGAVIANSQNTIIYRPEVREREFLTILKSLATLSAHVPAFTQTNCLQQLLVTLQQQTRAGNLVYILSDFFQFNAAEQKLILALAKRAQVTLIFVYDPFEKNAPPAYSYRLTDGETTAIFNMENRQNRHLYQEQFEVKLNSLLTFSHQHNIILQTLCTDEMHKLRMK